MTESTNYELNTSLSVESLIAPHAFSSLNIESVKSWLRNPMQFNKEIRQASRMLYGQNGVYANVIDYMVALPTLDRVVYGNNVKNKNHDKAKQKYLDALESIRDKTAIRDMLYKAGIDAIAFYYLLTSEEPKLDKYYSDLDIDEIEINAKQNCTLFPLPTDYCKIVGIKNSSYVVAFNLAYFDQFLSKGLSVKLRKYPKEIIQGYKNYKNDSNKQWVVLDNDKTVTIKSRSKMEESWGRPIGLSAYIDMLYDEYFVDTKRNVLDDVNSTIIYQTFPEGEKKGQSSLTQKQQKSQHDNIKQALFSKGQVKGINFFSVASGTKLDKLNANIDFLKTNNEKELITRITTNLGFAGSLLNAESGNFSSQKSNLELITAEIMQWIEMIQYELNKVINANIVKDRSNYIKVSYLPITYANRKDMVGYARELYQTGSGSKKAWIASIGFDPEAYLALMDEEIEQKFDEKYPPHPTSFTMSGKDSENTKPINNDSDNPSTIKNKISGSNPLE